VSIQNKLNNDISMGVRDKAYYSDSGEDDESACSDSESTVPSFGGTVAVAVDVATTYLLLTTIYSRTQTKFFF
jgi:hypothetical protein